MLNKPSNWDTIEGAEFGSGTKLPPGPYSCRIMNAYAKDSQKGNPMLVLELDIDSGEHVHFFNNKQKLAKFNQLTEGNSQKFFKGLINRIEESNPDYVFDFDLKSLINKRCCAVFREEEFVGENGAAVAVKIWYITSLQKMQEGIEVPKIKKLSQEHSSQSNQQSYIGNEVSINDEDLPF